MFFKIGVLKNFSNFTVKHLCWSLVFNEVKKRLQRRCFYVKFVKFLGTLFFTEHHQSLLLDDIHFSLKLQISASIPLKKTPFPGAILRALRDILKSFFTEHLRVLYLLLQHRLDIPQQAKIFPKPFIKKSDEH